LHTNNSLQKSHIVFGEGPHQNIESKELSMKSACCDAWKQQFFSFLMGEMLRCVLLWKMRKNIVFKNKNIALQHIFFLHAGPG